MELSKSKKEIEWKVAPLPHLQSISVHSENALEQNVKSHNKLIVSQFDFILETLDKDTHRYLKQKASTSQLFL